MVSGRLGRAGWAALAAGFFGCGLLARPALLGGGAELRAGSTGGVGGGDAQLRGPASRNIRRILGVDDEHAHPLIPGIDLEEGPLRPLAQTAGQMKRDLLVHYINTPEEDRWGDEEYEILALAINSSVQLMGEHRRRSGRAFVAHSIGSGSCGLKAGLDAVSVAALIAHGTYIKEWTGVEKPLDDCKAREAVREWFGDKTEDALWKFTALFAHGPSNWAPSVWLAGLEEGVYNEQEKAILAMSVCDDIEEAVDGELLWTMNWKGRPANYHSKMIEVAKKVGNDYLVDFATKIYTEAEAFFGKGGNVHKFSEAILDDVEAGGPSKEFVDGVEMINKHCNPEGSQRGLGTHFIRPRWLTHAINAQKMEPYRFLETWDQWRDVANNYCTEGGGGLNPDNEKLTAEAYRRGGGGW